MVQPSDRDYLIHGDAMVYVKGNGALGDADTAAPRLFELGLASEGIQIGFRFYHDEVKISQTGEKVSVETRTKLSDVEITMKLVHFDQTVLKACICESLGGQLLPDDNNLPDDAVVLGNGPPFMNGWVAPAGTFLGGGNQLWESGCHYISVGITSPTLGPYRFPACYLTGPPLVIPIGVQASIVELRWKAIPYRYPFQGVTTSGIFSGNSVRGTMLGIATQNIGSGYLVWDYEPLDDSTTVGG